MAGFLCLFLDSCNSIPYHVPSKSKPFRTLTPIHLLPHYPLISTKIIRKTRKTRTSRDSLQISALSQKFHLIQTTVHHDGSLIFQFGDPSEILKNDEIVQDLASEGEEGTHGFKVVEGDHEKQVIIETIESEERDENGVSSSKVVSRSVNGTAVIEKAGDVEKDLSDPLMISSVSDSVVEDLEGRSEEESNDEQVLDGSHEKQVIRTTAIEERSDNDRSTDASETQMESSEPDELVEDLESDGEERSNDVTVDVDHEKQELDNTIKIEEMSDSDTSSSRDVSDSSDEADNEILVEERDNDLTNSQEESNDRLVEISRDEGVLLPFFVSISKIETNDFVSSGLGLEDADDNEQCSDEDESSSQVEIEVTVDSFTIGRTEDSEEVIASLTKFESLSSKIEPSIDDPNVGVMQFSDQKIEVGSQFEVANSSNEAEADISVVEKVSNVVGDLGNNVNVDEDHKKQKLEKMIAIEETAASDTSSSSEVFECSNEVDNDITLVEREKDLTDSQEESNERLAEISQDGEVPLALSVSVSDIEIEVADRCNVTDGDINLVERESEVVRDLRESKPELNETPLVLSEEVGVPVSDSKIITTDHFGSFKDVVADEDDCSLSVTDSSLSVQISGDIEDAIVENSTDANESSLFELNELDISDPINEVVNLSINTNDQNIVSELELAKIKDSGDIDAEEVMPLAQGFEAETVLDDGVGHDPLEELSEAGDVHSPMLLNQDFSNSLVGAERTEVEEQSNELSEVPIVEMKQLELAETDVEREEISTTAFILSSGAAALTHPSKALTGGEDAYFLTSSNWLGIADGISQWSLEGIVRGIYAHELMKNCEIIVSAIGSAPMVNPIEVLSRSVEETESSGSSTALVAYFDGQALHVANLGDTGFIIIRHGAVYKKSSPMFHEFNFPVHIQRGDNPSQFSKEYIIDLYEEDTIITATDGLFDNLYDLEIASIVSKSLQAAMKPEEIAQLLATRAQEGGKTGRGRSPFADAAKAAGYIGFTGGKLDDVTVIVSLVMKRSKSYI